MNKYSYLQLMAKYLWLVILLIPFYSDAAHVNSNESSIGGKKILLSNKQIRLLDVQTDKAVPECRFIYRKTPIDSIKRNAIYECVERFSYWFWSNGNYKILGFPNEKINNFHLIDDYLGNRIMPYLFGLSKTDQSKFLRKIALYYSENLIFIQAMMDHGVSVKEVLLQQMSEGGGGGFWASCEAYMLILNKNISLYQDNNTLYEPIPDVNEMRGIKPSYRWEDLHHLANPTYNICPEVIEQLARANPELLNKRDGYEGATPLHLYLIGAFVKTSRDIQLASKLATPVNINMKTNDGDTPLHRFLINTNTTSVSNKKKIIKMMIARGADINIKNNEGITVKDMILKRTDLSEFFK